MRIRKFDSCSVNVVLKISIVRRGGFIRQLISLICFGYCVDVIVEKASGVCVDCKMKVGRVYTIVGKGSAWISDVNYRKFFSVVVLIDKKHIDGIRKI